MEKPRAYNALQVIKDDTLWALSETYAPFSSCIEQNSGHTVGIRHDFYSGHLPIESVKANYDHKVKVLYTHGEYGEYENQPLTRVSYCVVTPLAVVEVK